MTKCPPPARQPIRAPTGRCASISARIVSHEAVPDFFDLKLPVRLSALSRYHGTLQVPLAPSSQQVDVPSSAFTTGHCPQVVVGS
jgi:hypothetical protein